MAAISKSVLIKLLCNKKYTIEYTKSKVKMFERNRLQKAQFCLQIFFLNEIW